MERINDRHCLSTFLEQNGLCYYCETFLLTLQPDQVTRDHKIPKSKGGPDNKENICISCKTCNQLKKAHPEESFMKWLKDHKKTIQSFNTTFNSK